MNAGLSQAELLCLVTISELRHELSLSLMDASNFFIITLFPPSNASATGVSLLGIPLEGMGYPLVVPWRLIVYRSKQKKRMSLG